MLELNRQQETKQFLDLFEGNVDAAIASLKSINIKMPPKVIIGDNVPVVVETQNLSKIFKLGSERVNALDDINIKIQQGEFITITGESGSGKSTLLQLIGGLDKPSSGKVVINDIDISKMRDNQLSEFRNKTVGFVFQFFYLQPFLNLELNLEVPGMFAKTPKKTRQQSALELATAVGLADRTNHLPKELSGGQMQRAAIARALLNKPKIILADEPTGNLDQATSVSIIDLLEKIRQTYGTTIILVTHDKDIALRSDREIKLSDGKILPL